MGEIQGRSMSRGFSKKGLEGILLLFEPLLCFENSDTLLGAGPGDSKEGPSSLKPGAHLSPVLSYCSVRSPVVDLG